MPETLPNYDNWKNEAPEYLNDPDNEEDYAPGHIGEFPVRKDVDDGDSD